MSIEYKYNEEDNLVFTNPVGILDINDIKEYFTDLLNSKVVQNDFIEVVSLEDVDDFTIDYKNCLELSKIIKKLKEEKHYEGAVIYAPDVMVMSITKLFSGVLRLIGITNINIVDDKNEISSLITMMRNS